jgi:hypothetical protein
VPATAKEETEEELRRAMDASAEVEIVGRSFAPKSEGLQAVQREANFEGQGDIKDQAKAAGAAGVNLQGQAKVAGTVGLDLQGQAKAVPAPGGKGDKNGPEATGQPAGEPASQPPASSTALAAAESQSDERAGQAADKGEGGDNGDDGTGERDPGVLAMRGIGGRGAITDTGKDGKKAGLAKAGKDDAARPGKGARLTPEKADAKSGLKPGKPAPAKSAPAAKPAKSTKPAKGGRPTLLAQGRVPAAT